MLVLLRGLSSLRNLLHFSTWGLCTPTWLEVPEPTIGREERDFCWFAHLERKGMERLGARLSALGSTFRAVAFPARHVALTPLPVGLALRRLL